MNEAAANRKVAAQGVAAAMAMSNPTMAAPLGKIALGVSVGTYDSAFAVGVQGAYTFTKEGAQLKAGVAGGSGGNVGVKIGVNVPF